MQKRKSKKAYVKKCEKNLLTHYFTFFAYTLYYVLLLCEALKIMQLN